MKNIKRTVEISAVTTEGVILNVIFDKAPSTWLRLNTPYAGMGCSGSFFTITSQPFADEEEAKGWIQDLTGEIIMLFKNDNLFRGKFAHLEGTATIMIAE